MNWIAKFHTTLSINKSAMISRLIIDPDEAAARARVRYEGRIAIRLFGPGRCPPPIGL
jgi:hypothetical protein